MKETKYRDYTDEDIIKFAAEVPSMSQLLSKLGLKKAGGNFSNMERKIRKLNINTDHWTGKVWAKGRRLKEWSNYTSISQLKKHLITLRGHKCEICNNSEWLGKQIKLEIHHIDGFRDSNKEENLQLLRPFKAVVLSDGSFDLKKGDTIVLSGKCTNVNTAKAVIDTFLMHEIN